MKGIVLRGVEADGSYNPNKTVEYVFGDLEQGNKPWLDEESGQPLALATLKLMSRKDIERIKKPYLKRRADGSGDMQEYLSDPESYRADLLSALIVDWKGLLCDDGVTPLECTRKTRMLLKEPRITHMMSVAIENESVAADASFRGSH